VSLLEERIASLLPASNAEGAIARCGAITAAISANQFERAGELAARFSTEGDLDAPLRSDLRKLKKEALSMAQKTDQAMATRYPHASARYGIDEVKRFAREFHQQGAPLPIS